MKLFGCNRTTNGVYNRGQQIIWYSNIIRSDFTLWARHQFDWFQSFFRKAFLPIYINLVNSKKGSSRTMHRRNYYIFVQKVKVPMLLSVPSLHCWVEPLQRWLSPNPCAGTCTITITTMITIAITITTKVITMMHLHSPELNHSLPSDCIYHQKPFLQFLHQVVHACMVKGLTLTINNNNNNNNTRLYTPS